MDNDAVRPPLPKPLFPVYGLDASFDGPRSIDGWNRADDPDEGPLWYVSLLHGSVDGSHVVVITDAKLPASPRDSQGDAFRGSTGLVDAALLALSGMASSTDQPEDPAVARELGDLQHLAQSVGGDGWTAGTCVIDGRPISVSAYRFRRQWAAAVDIGQVAIGLHGAGIEISEIALDPVNATLRNYETPQD
ncbi:hypothetical protein [Kribbella sindirgiensis]|uniref:Uncharacterized protein n=1 Tax=Kribbella sindirgiensis TaxID=1124744 RepID=A0A4R0IC73_9ACTN|nr:hypothetical protein [Kribbella sindirgiensis]TCC28746.1 hypothetical protein E0H50_28390 [Kribbella sindirgiensis]